MPKRWRRERGFALVAVLWLLILLAFLASSYSASTRTGAYLTRNLELGARAEALADAGIYRVLWELLQLDTDRPLRTDGTVYEWAFGNGRVRFAVHDEAGKIDVNVASENLLQRLFVAVGVDDAGARALAEAIAAFRDSESKDSGDDAFVNGIQDLPTAEEVPFRTIDELEQVSGMSAAIFARVRSLITVYTGMSEPDVAVAPAAVRAAMEGLAADRGGAFAAVPPAAHPALGDGGAGPLSVVTGGQREDQDVPPGDLALAAEIVAIHAEARMPSGAVFAREAVAEIGAADQLYRFYVWRQAPRQYFPPEQPRH